MKHRPKAIAFKGLSLMMVTFTVLSLTCCGAKTTTASEKAIMGPSTFDLYAPFLSNTLTTESGECSFPFKVRALPRVDFNEDFTVAVECASDSLYLKPMITRETVELTPANPQAEALLRVEVDPDTPDGKEGWVKVTGRRGSESHTLHFRIRVHNAAPVLNLGVHQGQRQQELLLSNGEELEVFLEASNEGALNTTFPLSASAPPGWSVRFLDENGQAIRQLSLKGVLPYLELPSPVTFRAVVDPPGSFPKNPPTTVTFRLGSATAAVRVARRGMLWSANDLNGIYPHVHQVLPGSRTTYRLQLTNITGAPAIFGLRVKGVPEGWKAVLSRNALTLGAGSSCSVDLILASPPGAPQGQAAEFTVIAEGKGISDSVRLAARVTKTPKIYFFSVDSLSYSYLTFNGAGTGPGRDGDWLMPNVHAFMSEATSFTNASALMPAATDMNHTSVLTGCYPGTEGIYCVSMTFNGTTPEGRMMTQPTSLDHGLTIRDGQKLKVERLFETVKRNNPEALCAFLSNKNWLVDLHSDTATQSAVERSVNSERRPAYLKAPDKFVLGDPATDNDPVLDPLQKNFLRTCLSHMLKEKAPGDPWPATDPLPKPLLNALGISLDMLNSLNPLLSWLLLPMNLGVGNNPSGFASDTYISEALLTLIAEEDPDVVYCNLGELDETGHMIGSAEKLEEWDSKGTACGRDDTSRINNFALRDDALDVARQADAEFKRFIETLKQRGTYESSIIIFLADHGMHNYKRPEMGYKVLDDRELLRAHGFVMGTDFDYLVGMMDYDAVFSRDKTNLPQIERVLEDYEIEDPKEGDVHPLVVFNRQEMRTGVDERTGIRVNPGEFYSSYWTATEIDQAGADSMKWPDLLVYTTHDYYSRVYGDTVTTGANAVGIKSNVNLPSELSIMAVGGHISFDTRHVPLIVKLPGATGGNPVNRKVFLTDVAPTLYEYLGWDRPPYMDGKPLPMPVPNVNR